MSFKQIRQKLLDKTRAYIAIAKEYYTRGKSLVDTGVVIMRSPESDRYFAAAAYLPFVGWFVPLYLREGSQRCQLSAKQGLALSVIAVLFLTSAFFVELFIPQSLKVVSFVLIVLTYIFNFGYIAVSIAGIYNAICEKEFHIPLISEKMDKLFL